MHSEILFDITFLPMLAKSSSVAQRCVCTHICTHPWSVTQTLKRKSPVSVWRKAPCSLCQVSQLMFFSRHRSLSPTLAPCVTNPHSDCRTGSKNRSIKPPTSCLQRSLLGPTLLAQEEHLGAPKVF